MPTVKVLFLCVHNSARSQMAEAFLKKMGGREFQAESAGLEPGKLNPLAIEVMKEEGIDLTGNPVNDVFDFFRQGKHFHYIITVCDEAAAERCPVFPGVNKKIVWSFDDPSRFTGSPEEQLAKTRKVRDSIKLSIKNFVERIKG